jgi:hypothetical protein
MAIRLTETQNIVKNTPMGGNVGIDKYVFLIDIVQKTILEPVLGTKLYKKIQEDYNNNTLTGLYLQMYDDYIVSFLNYAVYAKYVHSGNNRIRNNGDLKTTPNNSQIMTNQENISSESEYMNLADAYLNDLESFLHYEGVNIPEYKSQDNRYDKKSRNNNGYALTWYLGNSCGCSGGLNDSDI